MSANDHLLCLAETSYFYVIAIFMLLLQMNRINYFADFFVLSVPDLSAPFFVEFFVLSATGAPLAPALC